MTTYSEKSVDILMATYNGEKYIEEQIDSIVNQTHGNIRVLIRDDVSPDNTCVIIKQMQIKYPGKIILLPTTDRLGVIGNFSTLLDHAQADYVMFSDQDDKWLPEKIETSLKKMLKMEKLHGNNCPLLIHTDLQVVDDQLNVINPSYNKLTGIIPKKSYSLNRLLVQNVVTGCTMMMNRSLVNLSKSIPRDVIMHDWWIALVAVAFGKIDFVEEATMLYRQHANNQIGARKNNFWSSIVKIWKDPKLYIERKNAHLIKQRMQAEQFLKAYSSKLSIAQSNTLEAFAKLELTPTLRKKYMIIRYGFYQNGFKRMFRQLFLNWSFLERFLLKVRSLNSSKTKNA